jgi:hypothetical protein
MLDVHTRLNLIRKAAEAALVLDQQLNVLLDAYDFYVQRYEAVTPSEELELADLQVSIKELGSLPRAVAVRLDQWRKDQEPALSADGFEISVLNEFNLHMNAVATFLHRKHIDLEAFVARLVGEAFMQLRDSNRLIK